MVVIVLWGVFVQPSLANTLDTWQYNQQCISSFLASSTISLLMLSFSDNQDDLHKVSYGIHP
jgi:hypothetical protein